jgi:hypothetical protein
VGSAQPSTKRDHCSVRINLLLSRRSVYSAVGVSIAVVFVLSRELSIKRRAVYEIHGDDIDHNIFFNAGFNSLLAEELPTVK